jgi:hypothetical protein
VCVLEYVKHLLNVLSSNSSMQVWYFDCFLMTSSMDVELAIPVFFLLVMQTHVLCNIVMSK